MPPNQLWLLCDQDTWFGWCFWSLHKWWVFLDECCDASKDDGPFWMNDLVPPWMMDPFEWILWCLNGWQAFWMISYVPPWMINLFERMIWCLHRPFGWMLWCFMDDGPFAESWFFLSQSETTWVASTVRNPSCAMTDTNSRAEMEIVCTHSTFVLLSKP